jgi:hypothetical protein
MKGEKMKSIAMGIALALLAGCSGITRFHTATVDSETGYLPVSNDPEAPVAEVKVIKHAAVDLKDFHGRILVTAGDFAVEQMRNLHVFENVMSARDMDKALKSAGVDKQLPTPRWLLDLRDVYRLYGPFLWFHFDAKKVQDTVYDYYVVTDPSTGEDLYEVRAEEPKGKAGATDQTTWFPMFNALIDWLRANGQKVPG